MTCADPVKWTIWAPRPGSRALLTSILECHRRWEQLKSRRLRAAANFSVPAGEGEPANEPPRLTELDVISVTGPGVFSRGVLDVLRSDTGSNETALSGLTYPCRSVRSSAARALTVRSFGSLLALPVSFWSPGEHHSGSKGTDDSYACVRHHCASYARGVAADERRLLDLEAGADQGGDVLVHGRLDRPCRDVNVQLYRPVRPRGSCGSVRI